MAVEYIWLFLWGGGVWRRAQRWEIFTESDGEIEDQAPAEHLREQGCQFSYQVCQGVELKERTPVIGLIGIVSTRVGRCVFWEGRASCREVDWLQLEVRGVGLGIARGGKSRMGIYISCSNTQVSRLFHRFHIINLLYIGVSALGHAFALRW